VEREAPLGAGQLDTFFPHGIPSAALGGASFQISDFRFQISDFRFQIADFRLSYSSHATKEAYLTQRPQRSLRR
jgi:hypothetical protein